jgi:chromate reductase
VLNRPEIMIGSAHERFDTDGKLTDAMTEKFMREQLVALAEWTNRLRADH